ncbi:hypothetical protein [Lysinibacillus fusiformis]|uniref:hypothetical protein n=1 Tax=Lysinibacillus fusiformis TaxID=28031 RepID=UPI00119D996E|nr:hypothetical protein [Lysinibacillus fusiformis]
MEKMINVNSKDSAIQENIGGKGFFIIQNTPIVKELVESYRSRLVEGYKEIIFNNWDEQVNLDLTEDLMRESVMIMDASGEEILKMFFEDAQDKYADMKSVEYFNQLFKAATQCP